MFVYIYMCVCVCARACACVCVSSLLLLSENTDVTRPSRWGFDETLTHLYLNFA